MSEEFTLGDRIDQFIRLRDKITEITAKHEKELEPYKAAKEKFEQFFLEHLNATGGDSTVVKGSGTIYKKTSASVTVRDGEAFRQWIIANDRFDAADIKANKTTISAMVEAAEPVPPGVAYSTYATVGVRRAGTKA